MSFVLYRSFFHTFLGPGTRHCTMAFKSKRFPCQAVNRLGSSNFTHQRAQVVLCTTETHIRALPSAQHKSFPNDSLRLIQITSTPELESSSNHPRLSVAASSENSIVSIMMSSAFLDMYSDFKFDFKPPVRVMNPFLEMHSNFEFDFIPPFRATNPFTIWQIAVEELCKIAV